MRANVADASLGSTSVYITKAPSAAAAKTGCTAIAGTCTPAQMAENDLAEWYSDLVAVFPLNNIGISYAAPVYTISISWDDNRDGATDSADPTFQMSFQL
ncbi:hypothetical protein [Thiolapillus sp.]|uniref:hypothetical protein n=1 Tax=Thiolapillus sp. TaxID=2017437 RepID=UPI003AF4B6EC